MTFHRHPSFFPVVIILITLGLGAFMLYGLKPSPAPVAPAESSALSGAEYGQAMLRISDALDTTKQKVDAAAVDQALTKLLQLHVSAELQERHLNSAMFLLKWRDAITTGDAKSAAEAQAGFLENNQTTE